MTDRVRDEKVGVLRREGTIDKVLDLRASSNVSKRPRNPAGTAHRKRVARRRKQRSDIICTSSRISFPPTPAHKKNAPSSKLILHPVDALANLSQQTASQNVTLRS